MEKFMEPISANVWITLIICVTVYFLVKFIASAISSWQAEEIKAEKDKEETAYQRIIEKEEREKKKKAEEEIEEAKANQK